MHAGSLNWLEPRLTRIIFQLERRCEDKIRTLHLEADELSHDLLLALDEQWKEFTIRNGEWRPA